MMLKAECALISRAFVRYEVTGCAGLEYGQDITGTWITLSPGEAAAAHR
jgi:hypothetical protein